MIDAQEHLHEPAAKLYALERLLDLASSAEAGGDATIADSPECGKERDESLGDFFRGLSLLIGDAREELEALARSPRCGPGVVRSETDATDEQLRRPRVRCIVCQHVTPLERERLKVRT
jgi:hypothetical protein